MSYPGDQCTPGSGPHLPSSCLELRFASPLTPPSSPTIVLKESRMNASLHCRGGIVSVRPRQWACLVLALLLLYNPFFAAIHASSGLDLARPASNRATVGASELQHFSPANGWGCLFAGDFTETAVAPSPPPQGHGERFLVFPLVSLISPQFSGPGLWFRPPPAL